MNACIDKPGLLVCLLCLGVGKLSAEGIPEPSLVIYGTIKNAAPSNERIVTGRLVWQFRSAVTGQTVAVEATVTNLLDQFSYVMVVPCEQTLGPVSTNVLSLSPTSISFDRSQVFYQRTVSDQAVAAAFVVSTQSTTALSVRDRGRIERVDLLVTAAFADSNGNGIPDDWEMQHFGYLSVDPGGDPDHDGLTNKAEYLAGTDPNDAQSVFQFLSCELLASGAMQVRWQSVSGRSYSLLRYPSLLSTHHTVVKQSVLATPPVNTLLDPEVSPTGVFFYRLLVEP